MTRILFRKSAYSFLLIAMLTIVTVAALRVRSPAQDHRSLTSSTESGQDQFESVSSRLVTIKFKSALGVHLRPLGSSDGRDPHLTVRGVRPDDAKFDGLPPSDANKLLQILRRYSAQKIQASLTDEQLERAKARAKADGRTATDLGSWYRITLSPNANRDAFIAALRELESVDIAEPVGASSVP